MADPKQPTVPALPKGFSFVDEEQQDSTPALPSGYSFVDEKAEADKALDSATKLPSTGLDRQPKTSYTKPNLDFGAPSPKPQVASQPSLKLSDTPEQKQAAQEGYLEQQRGILDTQLAEFNDLKNKAGAARADIDKTAPGTPEYISAVQKFNSMVGDLNRRVDELKKHVGNFNTSIEGYQGETIRQNAADMALASIPKPNEPGDLAGAAAFQRLQKLRTESETRDKQLASIESELSRKYAANGRTMPASFGPQMMQGGGTRSDFYTVSEEGQKVELARRLWSHVRDMDPNSTGVLPAVGRAAKRAPELFPFYRSGLELSNLSMLLPAVLKASRGEKLNPLDEQLVDAYAANMAAGENFQPGFSDRVMSGIIESMPYVAEFAATSGVGDAISGGINKGAEKAVKKVLGSRIERWVLQGVKEQGLKQAGKEALYRLGEQAIKLPGALIGGSVQGMVNLPEIAAKTLDNAAPKISLQPNDKGSLVRVLDSQGDDGLKAFRKAVVDQATNYGTERIGGIVDEPLDVLKSRMLDAWIAKRGFRTLNQILEAAHKVPGWNGIIGETFEELAGLPIQNLNEGAGMFEHGFSPIELAELVANVGGQGMIMGGPIAAIDTVQQKKATAARDQQFREQGIADAQRRLDAPMVTGIEGSQDQKSPLLTSLLEATVNSPGVNQQIQPSAAEASARQEVVAAIQNAAEADARDQVAAGVAQGQPIPTPPQPRQPEYPAVTDDYVEGIAQEIASFPPEERTQAITEAHDHLTQALLQQGKVVVGGKLYVIDSEKSASSTATKIINEQIKAHDETAKKPEAGGQNKSELLSTGSRVAFDGGEGEIVAVNGEGADAYYTVKRQDGSTEDYWPSDVAPVSAKPQATAEAAKIPGGTQSGAVAEPSPETAAPTEPPLPAGYTVVEDEAPYKAKKGDVVTFTDNDGVERTGKVKYANDMAVRLDVGGKNVEVAPSKVRGLAPQAPGYETGTKQPTSTPTATTAAEAPKVREGSFKAGEYVYHEGRRVRVEMQGTTIRVTDGQRIETPYVEIRTQDGHIREVSPSSLSREPQKKVPATATPQVAATKPETAAPAKPKAEVKAGDRVRWTQNGKELTGTVRDVDDDGRLSVNTDQVAMIGGRIPIGRIEHPKADQVEVIEAEKPSTSETASKPEISHETERVEKNPSPERVAEYRATAEPQKDIHGKPTGWLRFDTVKGAALVHPTENTVHVFQAKDDRSGTALQKARAEAQAWAMDNRVTSKPADSEFKGERYQVRKSANGKYSIYDRKLQKTVQSGLDEVAVAKEVAKIRDAQQEITQPSEPEHKYKAGNTQIGDANIPSKLLQEIKQMQEEINAEDLAGDGIEKDLHITVRYGLTQPVVDLPALRTKLQAMEPFTVTLGKTASFPPSESSDNAAVIILPVESKDLHTLNKELGDVAKFQESNFDEYRPHLTLAYVKPERAASYEGWDDVAGRSFKVTHITVSDRDGKRTTIELGTSIAKPEQAAEAKEPWQMTLPEWRNQEHNVQRTGKDMRYHRPDGTTVLWPGTTSKIAVIGKQWEYEVRQAIENGKPVPQDVLDDFNASGAAKPEPTAQTSTAPQSPKVSSGESVAQPAKITVKDAQRMGAEAFARGDKAVPGQDQALLDAVKEIPAGERNLAYIALMDAWSKGWHEANLAAAKPTSEVDTESTIEPTQEAEDGRAETTSGSPVSSPGGRQVSDTEGSGGSQLAGEQPETGTRTGTAEEAAASPDNSGGESSPDLAPSGAEGTQPGSRPGVGDVRVTDAESARKPARVAYRNTDWFEFPSDFSVDAGNSTRLGWNLAALKIVKKVLDEGYKLTDEDRDALAHFVGWGALQHVFDPARSPWKEQEKWYQAKGELEELLDHDAMVRARNSTQNAHYTAPEVVRFMWDAAKRMGFKGGAVLEPAMGTGNFFGLMPKSIRNKVTAIGNELDPGTYQIAKLLYPSAQIYNLNYVDLIMPDDSIDLAIGNPPFGVEIYDPKYRWFKGKIHDYFFVKTLDKVRPGGVVMFITSSGTLDKRESKIREALASKADLVAAFRLPSGTFDKNAGTAVTTDLIVLRKRIAGEESNGEKWTEAVAQDMPVENENRTMQGYINEYYVQHPENLLGTSILSKRMNISYRVSLKAEGKIQEKLAEALKRIPGGIFDKVSSNPVFQADTEAQFAKDNILEDQLTLDEKGQVMQRRNGVLVQPESLKVGGKLSPDRIVRAKAMIALRDQLNELLSAMKTLPDTEEANKQVAEMQKALKKTYDAYKKRHGLLHELKAKQVFDQDPHYPRLLALEKYDRATKIGTPADIFTKRTIFPRQPLKAISADPKEGLYQVLADRGKVDLDLMAQLSGKSVEEISKTLSAEGLIYKEPVSGEWQTKDKYLTGFVRDKLRDAEKAVAQGHKEFQGNVEALKKVIPENIPINSGNPDNDIEVRLGSTWIPTETIEDFIREELDGDGYRMKVQYFDGIWKVDNVRQSAKVINSEFGNGEFGADQLLEMALNLKTPIAYDKVDDKAIVNQERTIQARQLQTRLSEKFSEWAKNSEKWAKHLEDNYNYLYNGLVLPEYDGSHLTFPGMNAAIQLRPHQKSAIWRIIQDGRGLLAHVVGAGKTFEMAASAMEMRRLGLAKKILITVPNHLVQQWANEFLHLYPGANLLVATKADFETTNRRRFMAKLATTDFDAAIIAHSQFNLMDISKERQEKSLQAQMDELEETIRAATAGSDGSQSSKRTVKQLEKAKDRLKARLDKLRDLRADKVINFDDTGIDTLIVDEAHEYKNLAFYTKMTRVAGLGQGDSKRAERLKMKTDYLLEKNNGRGVIFATGTPVQNTMAELNTMIKYVAPDVLEKYGIRFFDDWAANFGAVITAMELSADGRTYKPRSKFARFTNVPELINMFRSFADIKTAADLNLPVPKLEGGTFEFVEVPSNEIIEPVVNELIERAKAIRGQSETRPRPKPDEDNMLAVTMDGRKVATDARLLGSHFPDHPDSKINHAVKQIFKEWEEGRKERLTQLVFLDLFQLLDKGNEQVLEALAGQPGTRKGLIPIEDYKAVTNVTGYRKMWGNNLLELGSHISNGHVLITSNAEVPNKVRLTLAAAKPVDRTIAQDKVPALIEKYTKDKNLSTLKIDGVYNLKRKGEDPIDVAYLSGENGKYIAVNAGYLDLVAKNVKYDRIVADLSDTPGGTAVFYQGDKVVAVVSGFATKNLPTLEQAQKQVTRIQTTKAQKSKQVDKVVLNLYEDMRDKLVKMGIPRDEIAIIHEYPKEAQKQALFDSMNTGKVRILMGSTQKMGAGMNVQKKLKTLHHIDLPWRPGDLEQRNGRIIRQGNENSQVRVKFYATRKTFDAYMAQTLQGKAEFINQLLSGKVKGRTMTDAANDLVLTLEELKAIASGNPDVKRKMELEAEQARLLSLKQSHDSQQQQRTWDIRSKRRRAVDERAHADDAEKWLNKYQDFIGVTAEAERELEEAEDRLEQIKQAIEREKKAKEPDKEYIARGEKALEEQTAKVKELRAKVKPNFAMEILGKKFTDRKEALEYMKSAKVPEDAFEMTYNGIPIKVEVLMKTWGGNLKPTLEFKLPWRGFYHDVTDTDKKGDVVLSSINMMALWRGIPAQIRSTKFNDIDQPRRNADIYDKEAADLEKIENKPFPEQKQLDKVQTELAEVNGRLGIGDVKKVADEEEVSADVDSTPDTAEGEEDAEGDEAMSAYAEEETAAPAQTETPEFKRWFRNSWVEDADGKPLVVYHGTTDNIEKFYRERGLAGHFGTQEAANTRLQHRAEDALEKQSGQNIMPVYLSIQNPVRMSDVHFDGAGEMLDDLVEATYLTKQEAAKLRRQWGEPYPYTARSVRSIVDLLEKKGYDGIVYRNTVEHTGSDSWIPFHPNQVKSAIGNRGTFSSRMDEVALSSADTEGADGRVTSEVRPANGKQAPEVRVSTGAMKLILAVRNETAKWHGNNVNKRWAAQTAVKLNNYLLANRTKLTEEMKRDIAKLAADLKAAAATATDSGVSLIENAKAAPEEAFHSIQRLYGQGSVTEHIAPETVQALVNHPVAAKAIEYLRSNGYENASNAMLVAELAAKIGVGHKGIRSVLTADEAATWLDKYFDAIDQQHGTQAVAEFVGIIQEATDSLLGGQHGEEVDQGRENGDREVGGSLEESAQGAAPARAEIQDRGDLGGGGQARSADTSGQGTLGLEQALDRYAFEDEEMEREYQAAHGLQKEPLLQQMKDWATRLGHLATRRFEFLPRGAKWEAARFGLVTLEHRKGGTREEAAEALSAILKDLNADEYNQFERLVLLRDLKATADEGLQLPQGFTAENVEKELQRIEAAVGTSGKVRDSFNKRKAEQERIKNEYLKVFRDLGLDMSERMKRADYFRHQVLEYAQETGVFGAGRKLKAPTNRGFLKQREGSSKAINTDYLQAEYEYMAQVRYDIEMGKFIRDVVGGDYDILNSLKRAAVQQNESAVMSMFRDLVKQNGETDPDAIDEIAGKMFRETLNKKQSMAISRLMDLAANGDLPNGTGKNDFSGLLDSLSEMANQDKADRADLAENYEAERKAGMVGGKLDVRTIRQLIRYAGWVLKSEQGDEAARASALLFKGMKEKREFIEKALGENMATWRDVVPEGYTIWQPKDGFQFFTTVSIPEVFAKKIEAGLMEMMDVPKDKLMKVLARGGRFKQMVIPQELADTLDNLRPAIDIGPFGKVPAALTRAWKAWQLLSPRRFTKYNLRNLSGDAEAAFIGNPSTFSKVGQAASDLLAFFRNHHAKTPMLRAWIERGGMETLLQAQEIGDINNLEIFKHLWEKKQKGAVQHRTAQLISGVWKTARLSTDFREAILRYAAFLDYAEQMKAANGAPKNFGASIPAEVMALEDRHDRAFKMANDLLGAYDDISALGQWLRNYLPFWSFQEVNPKRYWRFFKNSFGEAGYGRTFDSQAAWKAFENVTGKSARFSPFLALKVGKMLLKMGALWALLTAWNYTFFRDDEESLSNEVKDSPHVILGHGKDNVLVMPRLGNLPDVLDWVGVDAPQRNLADWLSGRKTAKEVAIDVAKAPINKLWGAMTPAYKLPPELAFGKSAYPDLFKSRDIADRWEYLARQFALDSEYKWAMGKPSRGYAHSIVGAFLNEYERGSGAYYEILSDKRKFLESIGKPSGSDYAMSPRAEALRNIKLSIRFRDKQAWSKYTREYMALGGDEDNIEQSLERLHPLGGLSSDEAEAFVARMKPAQRDKLRQATEYYQRMISQE